MQDAMPLPDEIDDIRNFINAKRRIGTPVDVPSELQKLRPEEYIEATTAIQAISKALPLDATDHPGGVFPNRTCSPVDQLLAEITQASQKKPRLGLLGNFGGDGFFGLQAPDEIFQCLGRNFRTLGCQNALAEGIEQYLVSVPFPEGLFQLLPETHPSWRIGWQSGPHATRTTIFRFGVWSFRRVAGWPRTLYREARMKKTWC